MLRHDDVVSRKNDPSLRKLFVYKLQSAYPEMMCNEVSINCKIFLYKLHKHLSVVNKQTNKLRQLSNGLNS